MWTKPDKQSLNARCTFAGTYLTGITWDQLCLLPLNVKSTLTQSSVPDIDFCTIMACEKHILYFVLCFPPAKKTKTKKQHNYYTNKHSECHGCIDTGGFSSVCQGCVCVCVCVCVCECVGERETVGETVSLWKTSMRQHVIWCAVCIFLCICIGLILWEATYKQQSNVVPLSALWCCTVIHHKPPTETLFCATSLAAFPPSW